MNYYSRISLFLLILAGFIPAVTRAMIPAATPIAIRVINQRKQTDYAVRYGLDETFALAAGQTIVINDSLRNQGRYNSPTSKDLFLLESDKLKNYLGIFVLNGSELQYMGFDDKKGRTTIALPAGARPIGTITIYDAPRGIGYNYTVNLALQEEPVASRRPLPPLPIKGAESQEELLKEDAEYDLLKTQIEAAEKNLKELQIAKNRAIPVGVLKMTDEQTKKYNAASAALEKKYEELAALTKRLKSIQEKRVQRAKLSNNH